MNLYFITGTSTGIGNALAAMLLENTENFVVGISRKQTIRHKKYRHISLDLNDLDAVSTFKFPISGNETELTLINNAGTLGQIVPLGDVKRNKDDIAATYNINLVAPTLLSQQFIAQSKALSCKKVILNISSGAGKYPIKSWGTYCASKAAMDMLTRVCAAEHPEIDCYAVAPGVVDTPMQATIRAANPNDFSDYQRFINYHKNDELTTPKEVARLLIGVLKNPKLISDNVFSLRDLK